MCFSLMPVKGRVIVCSVTPYPTRKRREIACALPQRFRSFPEFLITPNRNQLLGGDWRRRLAAETGGEFRPSTRLAVRRLAASSAATGSEQRTQWRLEASSARSGDWRYEPICKIIDERWEHQLHRPLHAAAYFLNPHLHYEPTFKHDAPEVKEGLHICMRKLVNDVAERKKINLQLVEFHFARGLFSMEDAKESRKAMQPGEWWEMFGDRTPELKRFAIRVLSLTCSSSGCERNWSSFEMVHTKRRNRLHQKTMNDLVYVMYNLKLKSKQIKKTMTLPFEEIESDDEWITKYGYNDEIELKDPQGQAVGDGENIELAGNVEGSSTDPIADAFDLDNLVLRELDDGDAQSEEDNFEDDDDCNDDLGDGEIRGLDMVI
ncbi:hypothetical protein VNO78_03244 [Psophocarpus tetragonolobus]|uniref:HAT C-terminal dimerisation domain-containing protein n=1 Tax=Psophocarpus tetragonolobus TaxID=3891 RepID=A0AAN9T165_PSOTE